MNQPSVLPCVVPVLPATSARIPKRERIAAPVPRLITPRMVSTSVRAASGASARSGGAGANSASTWPSRSSMRVTMRGST